MRKIIYGLLTATLLLSMLTACASAQGSSSADKEAQSEVASSEVLSKESNEAASEASTEAETEATLADGQLNEGSIAPEIKLTDWDGNEFKLSDLKGKKVYVKFWASWCSACLAGMPDLSEMVKEGQDFEVITVVSPGNYNEMKKDEFKAWFEEQEFNDIKVYFDDDGSAMEMYGIRAFPTAAYIGSDGVLVGVLAGYVGSDDIIRAFDEIVK